MTPALASGERALRERAARARLGFAWTDAEMAELAADELAELAHELVLDDSPDD